MKFFKLLFPAIFLVLSVNSVEASVSSDNFSNSYTAQNNPPKFTSSPVTEILVSKNYNYNIKTDDPDKKDKLSISALQKPDFLDFKETGKDKAQLKGIPEPEDVGKHQVKLQVYDGASTANQNFVITVNAQQQDENNNDEEQDLKITSNPEKSAEEGKSYKYKVEADAEDKDVIKLEAVKIPDWTDFEDKGKGKGELQGTPGKDDAGNYEIILEATAGDDEVRQEFELEVKNTMQEEENKAPYFESSPENSVNVFDEYKYDIKTKDDNKDDELTLSVLEKPSWLEFEVKNDGGGTLKGTPGNDDTGTTRIVLEVSDGVTTTRQTFDLEVIANQAPQFTSQPDLQVQQGEDYLYNITSSDPEGDKLELKATKNPGWLKFDAKDGEGTLKGKADSPGSYEVVLALSDPHQTVEQKFTIEVSGNQPPEFTSEPTGTVTVGQDYQYTITASDPENDPLELKALELPGWLKLSSSDNGLGELTGTPKNGDTGVHQVSLQLSDGFSEEKQDFQVEVVENQSPAFESEPPVTATAGVAYEYNITVSDPENDEITIKASGLPGWLKFSDLGAGKASLSGTPDQNDSGSVEVEITASDKWDNTTTQTFTIVVSRDNRAPTFTSTPVNNASAGNEYSYNFSASDPDEGDNLVFSAEKKPSWLQLQDQGDGTGSLSGVPPASAVGNHEIILAVKDPQGATDRQTFEITVSNTGNAAPGFTSTPAREVYEDNEYSYAITATDPDQDAITIEAVQKPDWLTFTTGDNGSATLRGTPGNEAVGDHSIKLTVSDAAGASADQEFVITVINTNDAPEIISEPPLYNSAGTEYRYVIEVNDPDPGDRISFETLTVPSWLSITSVNGRQAVLSGTSEESFSGVNNVVIRVSDSQGAEDRQAYQINVNTQPVANDIIINILEDEPYTFQEQDFVRVFQSKNQALKLIRIEQLPKNGDLLLLSGQVTRGQDIELQSVPYLTYVPDENYNGEDSLVWQGSDRTTYSNQAQVEIIITPVNDAPSVENIPPEPLLYPVKRGEERVIAPGLEVVDVDNEMIQNGRVFIQRNFAPGEDLLRYQQHGQIEVNYNQEAGILNLTGEDTRENYEKVLRSVKYFNTNAENPQFNTRLVSFAVDDGRVESEWSSREIEVVEGFQPLDVPSAFTPDGDGINDQWIIENIDYYPECEIRIFTRWGQQVFASTGYLEPWDGRYNGSQLPSETYYYIIQLNEFADPYKGAVTLIR